MLSESQRKRARDLADQLERLGDIGWTNDPEISLRAGAMLNACDFLRSLAAQDHESGGVEGNAAAEIEAAKGGSATMPAVAVTHGPRIPASSGTEEPPMSAGIKPCPLSPQWISVKDRMPPNYRGVLARVPDNSCSFTVFWHPSDGWLYFGGSGKISKDRITHWMPLPPAPDEE